jgi:ABC-type phosphate transport system substrate-binding protein
MLRPDFARAEATLGGRPFSRPDETADMPAAWLGKAVQRPEGVDVALALDQQLYPAVVPLVQRYARETGLKVALQEGTCGIAAGALAEKTADITGMCCPPGPLDRLPGVRYHTLGIAALALIVNPVNPLRSVSLDEARSLFSGKARSWADLPTSGIKPGAAAEVQAVARLHCKGRPGHWRLLLDNESLFSPALVEVPAIQDMITEVSRDRAAIGYETLWHIADKAKAGTVRPLRLAGVEATDGEALAAGRYPLYRVFNITSWRGGDANPKAAALVDWLVQRATEMDPSYGIVPVSSLRRHGWRFVGDELVGHPG